MMDDYDGVDAHDADDASEVHADGDAGVDS